MKLIYYLKKISGLTEFKHGICILFSKITKKMFHVFITSLFSLQKKGKIVLL